MADHRDDQSEVRGTKGAIIVDKKYLRDLMQTTSYQLNLKYMLQALIKERLGYYANLDYDILASYLPENIMVKGDNSFLKQIQVLRSDPLDHNNIPCIGINKVQDQETEQFLGDQIDEEIDDNEKSHIQEGSIFQESIEIRIWAYNSDQRDYIAHTLKYILFEIRSILAQLGLMNQRISGGLDESDPVSYQPKTMFWSSFHLTGEVTLITALPGVDVIKGITFVDAGISEELLPSVPGLYREDIGAQIET